MGSILGSLSLGYLAVTGTLTTASVLGRGLAHAARHAIEGDFKGAATEVLSAVVAPAVLAGVAVTELVSDVFHGASALAEDTFGSAEAELGGRAA
jgi:hypothetical protein